MSSGSTPAVSGESDWRLDAAAAVVIFALSLGIYLPFLNVPFQFDDQLILNDDNLRLGRWTEFVFPPVPRVLTWLTFLIQFQIGEAAAEPLHAVSFLLHALNAVLVYFLLRTWWRFTIDSRPLSSLDRILPLAGGLLFALHPLQSEAVLYVYQRSTLLATTFLLAGCLSFLQGRSWMTWGCFAAAVSAKEFSLILPLALLIQQGLLKGSWRITPPIRRMFLAAGIVLGAFLFWLRMTAEATLGGTPVEAISYLLIQVKVQVDYLMLAILPLSLNLDHHVTSVPFRDVGWWGAVLFWIGLAAAFWRFRHSRSPALLGILLFFVWLLPTSSIVPSADLMFEHRAYPSMMGWVAVVIFSLAWLIGKAGRSVWPVKFAAGGFLVALLAFYTQALLVRAAIWRDPIALWRQSAFLSPGKFRPHFNQGVLLLAKDPEKAPVPLSKAIEINPAEVRARQSLGEAYFRLGRLKEARRHWEAAFELQPENPSTQLALGRLELRSHRYVEARKWLEAASERLPPDWRPHFHLARLALLQGQIGEAIRQSQLGLNRAPELMVLVELLADAVRLNRNYPRAAELYAEVLEQEPQNLRARLNLARCQASLGDLEQACREIFQVLEKTPGPLEDTARGLAELYACSIGTPDNPPPAATDKPPGIM